MWLEQRATYDIYTQRAGMPLVDAELPVANGFSSRREKQVAGQTIGSFKPGAHAGQSPRYLGAAAWPLRPSD
jgi:hypothetical protein